VKSEACFQTIDFGRERISFVLIYKEHNWFQITVKPDMTVEVQAPKGKPLEAVLVKVRRRAPWIRKQLRLFEEFQPRAVSRRFVSGETFRYLGRQYRLKVIASEKRRVHLSRPFMKVCVPDPTDVGAVKLLLMNWYQERAKDVFQHRLDVTYDGIKRRLQSKPSVRVRRMMRR